MCPLFGSSTVTRSWSQGEEEAFLMETKVVLDDLVTILDHLDEWTAPQPYPNDLLNTFNSLYTQPEPYGVVLIIAPWNYPFQLVMMPLMGAIAAGEGFRKHRKNRDGIHYSKNSEHVILY